ncbi:hypothetical protein D3C79_1028080 [compost metagenome]
MKFWYDQSGGWWRGKLGQPMQLTMIDNYGTAHVLSVKWGQKLNDGSIDPIDARNFLYVEIAPV